MDNSQLNAGIIKSSHNESVEVLLNKKMAGGDLNRTDILCKSILRIKESKGWVKIIAQSSNRNQVEGWLHQIYSKKLKQQCNYLAQSL